MALKRNLQNESGWHVCEEWVLLQSWRATVWAKFVSLISLLLIFYEQLLPPAHSLLTSL